MAFIPADAKWYVATLVVEILVENDQRNVVHENTFLIRADSPDEAYERSMELGGQHSHEDVNLSGGKVVVRFRGISHLAVVHDELEHGAELWWSEHVGISASEVQALIPPKQDLSVFAPIGKREGPDYSSREIMAEVAEILAKRKGGAEPSSA
jgi:Domain of unknown function (DUF4288)